MSVVALLGVPLTRFRKTRIMLITPWFRTYQQTLARKLSRGLATHRRSRRRVDTVSRMECLENRSLLSATMIDLGSLASNPQEMTEVAGINFFSAYLFTTGVELFMSDGSPTGSPGNTLVRNINTTSFSANSNPRNLTNVNDVLYFTANNGTAGIELWKCDPALIPSLGIGATTLVANINPGAASSSPSELTIVGNMLFFSATTALNGRELWKCDLNSGMTSLVKDIRLGLAGSNPSELTNVNGKLFFRATDPQHGTELWASDGTAAGTKLVKDIRPGTLSSNPAELTEMNNQLYFTANNGVSGVELWASNGTAPGTVMLDNIRAGAASSAPFFLTNVNGTLLFSANNGSTGFELWKSNGTVGGAMMVQDIRTGLISSNPGNLTNVGGTLFFSANNGVGVELWKSNGAFTSATLVKNINTTNGTASSSPTALVDVGGTLYFAANSGGLIGTELWKSDGTTAGTSLIQDIRPGASGSGPAFLTNVNLTSEPNTLFFAANDGVNGVELWKLCTDSPTAMYASGVLTVEGYECDDTITIRDVSGNIILDYLTGLRDLTTEGIVTGAVTTVVLRGKEGNDFLKLDSSLGVAVSGVLEGDAGNDTLFGGLGKDTYLFNTNTQIGSDTVMDAGGAIRWISRRALLLRSTWILGRTLCRRSTPT